MLLEACVTAPTRYEGANFAAFVQSLASQPQVCANYRELYVQGFRQNVAGLSKADERLQSQARENLEQSRMLLRQAGLSPTDCARPHCIIEPLQGGRLDSWCGYRLAADRGEELYQWLDWETVQASVQRQQ
ncbi:MAG: isopropylmalate isomerase [Marinobacter sp.]|nr:isopropylmalate isomerase [Marinobacter sp.]